MTLDGNPDPRAGSLHGRLARLGFADAARAVRLLSDPGLVGLGVDAVDDLALAPDPDLALAALSRVAEEPGPAARDFVAALDDDAGLRARAFGVLGTSIALGDHLVRHPEHWVVLQPSGDADVAPAAQVRAELLAAVGAEPRAARPRRPSPTTTRSSSCAPPTVDACSRSLRPT